MLEQAVKFVPYILRSITCFGFDICKGLYVHMNDQCNPVLSWDEREQTRTGNSSLPTKGLRKSLPGYIQKQEKITRKRRRIEKNKEIKPSRPWWLSPPRWT